MARSRVPNDPNLSREMTHFLDEVWRNSAMAPNNPAAFADLPSDPPTGMLRVVTDSNTATWGATVAAGGANTVLAFYNGTVWTVAAK
jgi:hypothetical protein